MMKTMKALLAAMLLSFSATVIAQVTICIAE